MTPRRAFEAQARACAKLGSPFMAQLMAALAPRVAQGGPVYDIVNGWEGDVGPAGASLPLRIAGGLHRLVLSGTAPSLSAVYPPNRADDADLIAAVEAAFSRHHREFAMWLANAPQTNEVRRAAVLIAATNLVAARYRLPVRALELGASAGLNLGFDRFGLLAGADRLGPEAPVFDLAPDWSGPCPPAAPVQVVSRRGVDLHPIPLDDPGARLRLLSYLWADQPERLEKTHAAIDAAAGLGITVDAGDAADWLEAELAAPVDGALTLIYHTIAWQYFPQETARRCRTAIQAAGRAATPTAPVAWLGFEADAIKHGGGIRLHLWPGDQVHDLGRADFHGRWIVWTKAELSA